MRNGGELSDLEHLGIKTEYTNISRSWIHAPLVFSGPLNRIIVDLNKP